MCIRDRACGAPVVCSNAASLPEVVGNAALLLSPHDVDGWANAMYNLATDSSLRESLHLQGGRRAQQFSWQQTAKKLMEVYNYLV